MEKIFEANNTAGGSGAAGTVRAGAGTETGAAGTEAAGAVAAGAGTETAGAAAGAAGTVEGRAHALLSASAAHRWLECTPSAVAESRCADVESEFAREGSLAHAVAARELKVRLGRTYVEEDEEISVLIERDAEVKSPQALTITGEMRECAEGYATFVMETFARARRRAKEEKSAEPTIMVEARLDFSDWVPDGFGTGDAVIIGGGVLEVIDLKFGKGVAVDARENPQMKLYALGALGLLDYCYDVRTVRMTIYQPRIGNLSEWEIPAGELLAWAYGTLRPLAAVAYRGLGARSAGAWCRFCRAKGNCRTLALESLALMETAGAPGGLRDNELPAVLGKLDVVKDWVKSVEEYSLARALGGSRLPGYKLVEGRSVRKIVDPEGVAAVLEESGGRMSEIWRPRELQTLTELERRFGKKLFAELCGDYIVKPKGKPTLVPVSDKRPALDARNDFDLA